MEMDSIHELSPEHVELVGDKPVRKKVRRITQAEHAREMDARVREMNTDFNHYATSKSVSQNMLNISTIQGLIVTMVNLFYRHGNDLGGFQIGIIVLIALSLSLQFIIFVMLVVLAKSTETGGKITQLNMTVTSLSGLLLIITSAISVLAIYIPSAATTLGTTVTGNSTR